MDDKDKRRQIIASLIGALGGAGVGGIGGYLKRYTLGSSVDDLKRNPYYEKMPARDRKKWMERVEEEDRVARLRLAALGALGGAATGAIVGHNVMRPDSFVRDEVASYLDRFDEVNA